MMIRTILRRLTTVLAACLWLFLLAAAVALVQVRLSFGGNATLPVDCAVVFGAVVHGQQDAGPGITRRVETAVRLYQEGSVRRLILTGGKGDDMKESEAAVMAALAERLGVPRDAMALEEQATSTWENLVLTAPLVSDCESVIGISDRYHLRRIGQLALLQGWGVLPTIPSDRQAGFDFETQSLFRETLGVLYYSFVPSRYY
jgi:uncharacterized SAM-binding protein YcdF (DUF218 family)